MDAASVSATLPRNKQGLRAPALGSMSLLYTGVLQDSHPTRVTRIFLRQLRALGRIPQHPYSFGGLLPTSVYRLTGDSPKIRHYVSGKVMKISPNIRHNFEDFYRETGELYRLYTTPGTVIETPPNVQHSFEDFYQKTGELLKDFPQHSEQLFKLFPPSGTFLKTYQETGELYKDFTQHPGQLFKLLPTISTVLKTSLNIQESFEDFFLKSGGEFQRPPKSGIMNNSPKIRQS